MFIAGIESVKAALFRIPNFAWMSPATSLASPCTKHPAYDLHMTLENASHQISHLLLVRTSISGLRRSLQSLKVLLLSYYPVSLSLAVVGGLFSQSSIFLEHYCVLFPLLCVFTSGLNSSQW